MMVVIGPPESAAVLVFMMALITTNTVFAAITEWCRREMPTTFWVFSGVTTVVLLFILLDMMNWLSGFVALACVTYGAAAGVAAGIMLYFLVCKGASPSKP